MKKRIKIQGALILLALILFILFFRFTIQNWKDAAEDELFDILGIILILSGFLLRIIARGYKEEMSQKGHKLVTGGLYSRVRNPMYLGTLMVGIGAISLLLRLWTLPIFLVAYFAIYHPQVDREEKILLSNFGQAYVNYHKSVPKYFPKIHGLLDSTSHVYLLKWSWIKKEMGSLIATMIIIFTIELWQDARLFSLKEFFYEFLHLFLIIIIFINIVSILVYLKPAKQN
jgi:protein-S-isoprenylcysteine O-methyltransferase Ste14